MVRNIPNIHRPKNNGVTQSKRGSNQNQDQNSNKPKKVSVVIYNCSNYKMKSLGPKPLIKVYGNINLVDYQVDIIRRVIPETDLEIVLVVGEDAEKIASNRRRDIRIVENQLFADTNEAEYIRLGLNNIVNENVLIINADTIFNIDHIRTFYKSNNSCTLYDVNHKMPQEEVGILVVENKMTSIGYKFDKKWTGMLYLTGQDLENVTKLLNNRSKKKQYLFEVINNFLERKIIDAYEANGFLMKLDSAKSIEEIPVEHFNS